jgi:hypothetical protein
MINTTLGLDSNAHPLPAITHPTKTKNNTRISTKRAQAHKHFHPFTLPPQPILERTPLPHKFP